MYFRGVISKRKIVGTKKRRKEEKESRKGEALAKSRKIFVPGGKDDSGLSGTLDNKSLVIVAERV